MKSIEELGQIDRGLRAGEFTSYVRHLALGGSGDMAKALAVANHAPQRVIEAFSTKAAISGTAVPDAGPKLLVSAFIDSLRYESVFMAMLNGGLVRLPFRTICGAVATAAGSAVVTAGSAIPISKLALTQAPELAVRKAAAIICMSKELLRAARDGEAILSRNLRAEVAKAVDAAVIAILKSGASTSAATASPETDLEVMRAAVAPGSASRLYWIASPAVASLLAGLTATGAYRYPTVTWTGGTLKGVPLLVTDQASAGELLLVDASGVCGNVDDVEVVNSEDAALAMDSAPTQNVTTPTGSTAVSMMQTNSVAVRCVLYFGCEKIRASAVRILTGIAWASS